MKKRVLLSLFLSMGFLLTACSGKVSDANTAAEPPETESVSESPMEQEEAVPQVRTVTEVLYIAIMSPLCSCAGFPLREPFGLPA